METGRAALSTTARAETPMSINCGLAVERGRIHLKNNEVRACNNTEKLENSVLNEKSETQKATYGVMPST
jgi:hypothetical protein